MIKITLGQIWEHMVVHIVCKEEVISMMKTVCPRCKEVILSLWCEETIRCLKCEEIITIEDGSDVVIIQ